MVRSTSSRVFSASVTVRPLREISLCAGLSRAETKALQQVAFDQLAEARAVTAAPLVLPRPVNPERCVPASRR